MATHLGQPTTGAVPHPAIAPAWRHWSTAWTRQTPVLADRDDLTVILTPGAGHGSPACYSPADATIEVNAVHVAVDPAAVDPTDLTQRPRYAASWGLLVHEAAHAHHTHWDTDTPTEPLAHHAATLLEEARIEAHHLRRRPADRRWLHAAVTTLILDDLDTHDTAWTAATAAALLLARADAGVLTTDQVQPVRRTIIDVLGRKRLKKLERIWRRALRTRDNDTPAMLEWGRRWCRILGIHPSRPVPIPLTGGTGAIRDAAAGIILIIADEIATEAAAVAARTAAAHRRATARQAETRQQQAAQAAAGQVFGPPTTPTKPTPGTASPGRTRPPTEAEKTAARQLTRALRAAAYREATATRITSPTPPGRLNTRAAMTEAVQRSLGQPPVAEPWTRTVRRANPQPPLRVGICTDVSVSMRRFITPAASAGWIIAQAVDRIPGSTSASVTFGKHVTAITRPGKAPTLIRDYNLEKHTRGFVTAIDALDHTLGLSQPGHAARLLVVISDGEFNTGDTTAGQARLDRLATAGCALLWIAPPGSTPLSGAQVVILTNPSQAGQVIASAATAALAARP